MSLSLRLAGFETRDTLVWVYGSGFPKSLNISKAIDKMFDAEREKIEYEHWGRTNRSYQPNGSPFNFDKSKVKEKQYKTLPATTEAKQWEGWGTALKPAIEPIILARKPLSEKNVAENILKWGTGGINIDGCRIQYQNEKDKKEGQSARISKTKDTIFPLGGYDRSNRDYLNGRFPSNFLIHCNCDEVIEGKEVGHQTKKSDNRKDPNSFLRTGFGGERNENNSYRDKAIIHTNPDCPCYLLDQQSGVSKSRPDYRTNEIKKSTVYFANRRQPNLLNDEGGASRFFKQITFEPEDYLPFFYCAKASKSERNMGLEELPLKKAGGMQGRNDGSFDGKITYNQNHHPTVKPISLCQYLIKLITPPNGIVLDPFAGSGSTLIACKKLVFNFIGIELNPEYVLIAEKRLQAIEPNLFNEVNNGA
jgi:site-specific DNA-methyltransferase (adenine-specific)